MKVRAKVGLGIVGLCLAGASQAQGADIGYEGQFPAQEKLELSVCLDEGRTRHLSTESPSDATSCRSHYASCDEERCMIVFNGAVKVMDRPLLQRFGGDLYASAEQLRGSGFPSAAGQPFNQPPNGFADPVCTWYRQMGFDCPEGEGFPGSGGNPGPSSTPLPPGENDGCTLCTLRYLACFAQAGPNVIQHYFCIDRYQGCTMQSCG